MVRCGFLPPAHRYWRLLTGAAAGLLLAANAAGLHLAANAAAAEKITVFAAASTGAALEEVADLYQQQGGEEVAIVAAATSSLARQIAAGAPADLFLSALPLWMNFLEERGYTDASSRRVLLGNTLVLIAPRDSALALDIEPNFDLASAIGESRLVMGDPDHVPAGIYGKQALTSLGVWADVSPRAVRAGDVVAALSFVSRGEVAAGIVYATDAARTENVRIVGRFPADSHDLIRYDVALVANRDGESPRRFLDFLISPKAGQVFERHGFTFRPGTD